MHVVIFSIEYMIGQCISSVYMYMYMYEVNFRVTRSAVLEIYRGSIDIWQRFYFPD